MAKKKKPTRCEIRQSLERAGVDFSDYGRVGQDAKDKLIAAAKKAGYRQPAAGKNAGHTRHYDFFLSLRRAKCSRPRGLAGIFGRIFGR